MGSIYVVCMSPTLNRRAEIQHVEWSNAIEILGTAMHIKILFSSVACGLIMNLPHHWLKSFDAEIYLLPCTPQTLLPPVKLVHGLRTKPCPCVGRSWYGSGTSTWGSSPTCATPSRRGGDSSCWSGRHREDPGHRVNNQGCTHSQALSASSKSWVETWERDYIVLYIASYPGLPSQLFSQPWK